MNALALLLAAVLSSDDTAVMQAAAERLARYHAPVVITDTTAVYEAHRGTIVPLLDELSQRAAKSEAMPVLAGFDSVPLDTLAKASADAGVLGDAQSVVAFTLPSYSEDGTRALMQFQRVRRFSGGTRNDLGLLFLEKTAGKWDVKDIRTQRSSLGGDIKPVRVGGDVKAPELVHRVAPVYTPEAREERVQGVVIVEVIIDRNGNVSDVHVLKPLPYGLDQAAVDAVKQWKFRPGTLAGEPVEVFFNLTVNFRLE